MTTSKPVNLHECLVKISDYATGETKTCVRVDHVRVFLGELKILVIQGDAVLLQKEIEKFEKQITLKEGE